jgi:N-acetylneuraminate synthase
MAAFIIAEAGVNHNGSLDMARRLVDAAAQAGADAVKFQTFRAADLVTASARKAPYQVTGGGSAESQLEMLRRLELDMDSHSGLAQACRNQGVEFMSTPFDLGSLELLLCLGVNRIKMASGELTNAPLLLRAAQSQKPVILSTGMSTLDEIRDALAVLAFGYTGTGHPGREVFRDAYQTEEGQAALRERVTLLHCTSAYPAPFREVSLRTMSTLRAEFGVPVGISDHTEGTAVPVAAAALGAIVIEKHLTLDRAMAGPDHRASLEPKEFAFMVRSIREAEDALGTPAKVVSQGEQVNRPTARRSIVAAAAISAGEAFSELNIAIKRPGTGLSPMLYWDVIGKRATRAYEPDEAIEQ